jgi:ABC-2 type transport system permease protein
MAVAVRLGRPRPVGSFLRKELLDAVRQPWLLGVMVLGPFLVLAVFAVGYQDEIRPYRTVFVGDPAGPLATRLDASAERLEEFIDYRGVAADEARALDDLEDGDLDAVVILPADPVADVLAGEQSTLRVVHRKLDPIEQAAIEFASRLAVDEINTEVLSAILTEGQEQATSLTRLHRQLVDLAARIDGRVEVAEEMLETADAEVLVRPFRSEVDLDVEGTTALSDFYSPAAVVLLLQQFGVAFAALSFVRERQLGIVDVYRVSPAGSLSMLVGKYIAYLVLGAVVAAGLLGLVVAVTGVPFRGEVVDAAVLLGLVLLASVGLGFLISLLSKTDTQAVLLTMLVLLASLFFTGFFLSVDAIDWPFRALAYLLPATYGIDGLRDIQLQGVTPEPLLLAVVGVYAAAVAVAVYLGTRRLLTSV